RGAFYAWESQEGGEEGCTNFNVVDVFTHRPVRTYFRDKQIHISADVAYALRSYHEITGDRSLLEAGGARVILECARFYISRAACHADRETVDFADVIGPDEYHERVTNNAFTNRMIRHTMESALKLGEVFADRADWFDGLLREMDYERDWQLLRELCGRISPPVIRDGVIEQFDGYFALEDCSLDTVRARLCHPREYWGGDHGVAGTTQIIKQADVIAMMALFPEDFSAETVAANWAYYEPRTEHGSSLSACMYALTACRLGKPELAWDLFLRTAGIDMTGGGKEWAGEIYIGGTHPAANGGAWMIAALGFAGLEMKNGQPVIHPHLPEQITRLSFPIMAGGRRLRVTVTHDGGVIDSDS
ncbi:MAG: glycosyl hydrolase family 65 protein, partial [Aristaeellaceae bacterium]